MEFPVLQCPWSTGERGYSVLMDIGKYTLGNDSRPIFPDSLNGTSTTREYKIVVLVQETHQIEETAHRNTADLHSQSPTSPRNAP